jgi:cytochrome c oxidase cbb3-type subunit 3
MRRSPRGAPARSPRLAVAAAAAFALALPACEGASPAPPPPAPPSTSERVLVTAGEFRAGLPGENPPVRNPLEQDPNAAPQGRQLYGWFNCAGCHGAEGGGGIGPPLRDPQWIYGSDPASVFQTIAQGRPNGMPAFGGKIPDEHIWRIELFVRSLGGVDSVVRAGGSSGQSSTQPVQPREGQ